MRCGNAMDCTLSGWDVFAAAASSSCPQRHTTDFAPDFENPDLNRSRANQLAFKTFLRHVLTKNYEKEVDCKLQL